MIVIVIAFGIVCLLGGWAIGWAHAIYMGRVNETALLEECVKLDLEIEALKTALPQPPTAVLQGGAEAGAVL